VKYVTVSAINIVLFIFQFFIRIIPFWLLYEEGEQSALICNTDLLCSTMSQ